MKKIGWIIIVLGILIVTVILGILGFATSAVMTVVWFFLKRGIIILVVILILLVPFLFNNKKK